MDLWGSRPSLERPTNTESSTTRFAEGGEVLNKIHASVNPHLHNHYSDSYSAPNF